MKITRFKKAQRFRILVDNACFYSNAGQIREGVGDLVKCNTAVQSALQSLEKHRSGDSIADKCTVGLAGNWEGLNVQINIA